MKLSRNKISKLIKKKKHSRSKIHKKRDGRAVVFSKSKDYDKPITRKKGGAKGYHGRYDHFEHTMKRFHRGGKNGKNEVPQKQNEKITSEPGRSGIPASTDDPPIIVAKNVTPIQEPKVTQNKAVPLDNDSARQEFIRDFKILYVEFKLKYGTETELNKNNLAFFRQWRGKMKALITTYNEDNLKLAKNFVGLLNNTLSETFRPNGAEIIYTVDDENKLRTTIAGLMLNINDAINIEQPTKVNETDNNSSSNDDSCPLLPEASASSWKEVKNEIRKFKFDKECGYNRESITAFLTNIEDKLGNIKGISEEDKGIAEEVQKAIVVLRNNKEPNQWFGEWITDTFLPFLNKKSTLTTDKISECVNKIKGISSDFDNFQEFNVTIDKMFKLFKECYRQDKGNVNTNAQDEWRNKYDLIFKRYTVKFGESTKLKEITDTLNRMNSTVLMGRDKVAIEKVLSELQDKIEKYNKTLEADKDKTSGTEKSPNTSLSANELQTMQQKSAEALKSAQDHHDKVKELVKANPLATLTADTYNFDECMSEGKKSHKEELKTLETKLSMLNDVKEGDEKYGDKQDIIKEINAIKKNQSFVEPNPEYRKAQPKCKPFIDKSITERKQWVKDMKDGLIIKNPSDKCAAFTASESKKVDDYAAKCAKQENQVVVNITQAPINDTHKRMNITVFAPNKSEVVLQDYAHSTYEQAMHNFENLKMDGELDLSGLTNAASAAKDAVKKAASATITSAKKAVSGKSTKPDADAKTEGEAKTDAAAKTDADTKAEAKSADKSSSSESQKSSPGIMEKVKDYFRKGQVKEMKQTMENLQDLSDQLTPDMTPSEKSRKDKMVEEINALIEKLTPKPSTQVGGGDEPSLEQKVDVAKQKKENAEELVKTATQRVDSAQINFEEKSKEHEDTLDAVKKATEQERMDGLYSDKEHAETAKVNAEEELNTAKSNQEKAENRRKESEISHTQLKNELEAKQAANEALNAKDQATITYNINNNFENPLDTHLAASSDHKEKTQKMIDAAKVHLDTASEDKKEEAKKNLSIAKKMHSEATGKNSELLQKQALNHIGDEGVVNQNMLKDSVDDAVKANKEHINATYDNENASSKDKLNADENHASFLEEVSKTEKGKNMNLEKDMEEAKNNVENAKNVMKAEEEHKNTNTALVKAKAKLEKAKEKLEKVKDTASTKDIVEATKATNEFEKASKDHEKATKTLNDAKENSCNSISDDIKKKECDDKQKTDTDKRNNDLDKLTKNDGKIISEEANKKISTAIDSKSKKDIENLLEMYESILNTLRKMNGGPEAIKGNILVSQSVLDNMNLLLNQMISQQEIIVKALGKIKPENEIYKKQSQVVSKFLFEGVKKYISENVSVSGEVDKAEMEKINIKLEEFKVDIKKAVLSEDAKTKDVIDAAVTKNVPIISVDNRVKKWEEIIDYIRSTVLKLDTIDKSYIILYTYYNILAAIENTPLLLNDQKKIKSKVEDIEKILQPEEKENILSIGKDFFFMMFSKGEGEEDVGENITFKTLEEDTKKPDDYNKNVQVFIGKLENIQKRLIELKSKKGDSQTNQPTTIKNTDSKTINDILTAIIDQSNIETMKDAKDLKERAEKLKNNYKFEGTDENKELKDLLKRINIGKEKIPTKSQMDAPSNQETKNVQEDSIKNTIVLWKESLDKIDEIIKKYEEEKKAKAPSLQKGGKKHHSKKSKKRKSKSKSSRLKLTRKIASK